ncbi:MAG: hypothetical protein OES32_09895 [Acidobacteriota bacterium]|nr:hypothetical protein [Acidobacteriota bacterium]MDH3523886.1 hypothetical protein [Acidobacteriota bacterium]
MACGSFMRAAALILVLAVGHAGRAGADQPTRVEAVLEARAAAPLGAGSGAPDGTPAPALLFSMTAPDNAPSVRAMGDANGDAIDDLVVGIDESGTDNLFCVSGASAGTASVLWSLETADGVSGGAPTGEQSLVAASDRDGDGVRDVLLGTGWGGRTAYEIDGADGTIRWRLDTYLESESGWVYSLAELSDVTGDGRGEVAFGVGSDNDSVYSIDGASSGTGFVLWRYPAADAVGSVHAFGDATGDGKDDLVVAVWDSGQQFVALDGASTDPSGTVLWSAGVPGSTAYFASSIPDLTGDGVPEVLGGIWSSGGDAVRCLDGATGGPVWESTDVFDPVMSLKLLGDLTGDGTPEVIVASWDNAVHLLDGADGSRVWRSAVGTANGGDVWTVAAIDDVDGDALPDVVAGSFDTHVYLMSGADGAIRWAYPTANRVFSVDAIGDLDGDGLADVVAGTQDTTSSTVLYALSAGVAGGVIFADGFESGDTSAWTLVVP